MIPSGVEWALVADAQHARILERRAPAGRWSERSGDSIAIGNPPSRDLGRDRPGRVRESAASTRHAIEPHADPHREAKRAFARELARRLEDAAAADRYGRLILVAPPAFLGDLRAALGEAAQRRLHGTLDRDLVHAQLAELAEQLAAIRLA